MNSQGKNSLSRKDHKTIEKNQNINCLVTKNNKIFNDHFILLNKSSNFLFILSFFNYHAIFILWIIQNLYSLKDKVSKKNNSRIVQKQKIPYSRSFRKIIKINKFIYQTSLTPLHTLMSEQHYCSILGIKLPYTQNDLTQAYKSLAKKYHPDKIYSLNGDEEKSKITFIQIKDAYQALKKIIYQKAKMIEDRNKLKEMFMAVYQQEQGSDISNTSAEYFKKREIIMTGQFKQIEAHLHKIKEIQQNLKIKSNRTSTNISNISQYLNHTIPPKRKQLIDEQTIKYRIHHKLNIFTIERSNTNHNKL